MDRSGEGFTLLEVMIALSILAIGLLTLSAMQIRALSGGRSGKTDAFAITIAQDKMEDLGRKAWTHGDLNPTGNWATAQTVNDGIGGQSYTLDWRVTDIVATWTRSIDVRVVWNEPRRGNRNRLISSIRYNRDEL